MSCHFTRSAFRVLGIMIFILSAALTPIRVFAEEMAKHLVVDLKSGKTERFVLSHKPVLTFTDSECTFTLPSYVVTHQMADINKAYFVDLPATSLDRIDNDDMVTIDLSIPEHVVVKGIPSGTSVSIYDIQGVRLAGMTVGTNGCADINIEGLPRNATYIVSIPSIKNFKIYKR